MRILHLTHYLFLVLETFLVPNAINHADLLFHQKLLPDYVSVIIVLKISVIADYARANIPKAGICNKNVRWLSKTMQSDSFWVFNDNGGLHNINHIIGVIFNIGVDSVGEVGVLLLWDDFLFEVQWVGIRAICEK